MVLEAENLNIMMFSLANAHWLHHLRLDGTRIRVPVRVRGYPAKQESKEKKKLVFLLLLQIAHMQKQTGMQNYLSSLGAT